MKKMGKKKNKDCRFRSQEKSDPRKFSLGFSLTELAIVMAAFGLILAGIWPLIALGQETARREQAFDQIQITVANVRGYYGGQAGMPNSGGPALTAQLLANAAIPSYMQRTTTSTCTNPNNLCADSPWGPNSSGVVDASGTFRVCNWAPGATACNTVTTGTTAFFAVVVEGLSSSSCIGLAVRASSPAGATGLVEVNINGTDIAAGLGHAIQPVITADAASLCGTAGGASISFVYPLTSSS
jgi:type II secretory pathway pseudopilin PulG